MAGALTLVGSAGVFVGWLSARDAGAADRVIAMIAILSAAAVVTIWIAASFAAFRSRIGAGPERSALDDLPIPVVMFSAEGKAVSANMAAFRAFSVTPDTIRRVASVAAVGEALRGGGRAPSIFEDQRSGRKSAVRVSKNPDGGSMVWLEDATDPVRASREAGEFLGLVGHGLRPPLAAAGWLAGMVGDGGRLNALQKRRLSELKETMDSMSGSLDRLTLLARVESGAVRASGAPTDVIMAVKSALSGLAGEIGAKRISVRTSFPDGLPKVGVDKVLLQAAISEVVGNAVRHNRDGGEVAAEVRCDGGRLEVKVSDNGPGIPEKLGTGIFRKFVRGDNLQAADAGGGGLGLYLARSIVEASGGEVRFTSKEGEGSIFYVSFPLRTPGGSDGPAHGDGRGVPNP